MLHGARTTLMIGFVATVIAVLLGATIGGLAGYYGGRLDALLMRFTEIFQTIPFFLFAILLVAVLTPSIRNVIIAIAVVSWPPMARLVRGEFLSMRSREFVLACVSMGMSNARIILRHILPNTLSAIIVTGSLMIATAILIESALSFLGLSDPNTMSWGFIIGAGRTALRSAWWVCTIPGIAILVTVMAINLVGEGLNDALNPRCEPHERFAVKHCRNGALDREPDDRLTLLGRARTCSRERVGRARNATRSYASSVNPVRVNR